ncbi:uncharacterized protein ACOB8E_012915 [Sarcophilus harrisii]
MRDPGNSLAGGNPANACSGRVSVRGEERREEGRNLLRDLQEACGQLVPSGRGEGRPPLVREFPQFCFLHPSPCFWTGGFSQGGPRNTSKQSSLWGCKMVPAPRHGKALRTERTLTVSVLKKYITCSQRRIIREKELLGQRRDLEVFLTNILEWFAIPSPIHSLRLKDEQLISQPTVCSREQKNNLQGSKEKMNPHEYNFFYYYISFLELLLLALGSEDLGSNVHCATCWYNGSYNVSVVIKSGRWSQAADATLVVWGGASERASERAGQRESALQ